MAKSRLRRVPTFWLVLALWVASMMWLTASSDAQTTPPKTRFAIALVQGLRLAEQPGGNYTSTTDSFPILTPAPILQEKTVASGEKWVQVQYGTKTGWIPAALIEQWDSRHALRPNLRKAAASLDAYCSKSDAQQAYEGAVINPCMTFYNQALAGATKSRSPFPVISTSVFQMEGESPERYFEVLVPTYYSTIADTGSVPAPTNKLDVVMLIDATGSMSEHIAASKQVLTDVIGNIQARGIDAKFLVMAYRDTDGKDSECPNVMEASAPGEPRASMSSALRFGSANDGIQFLRQLKACGGGDSPEAIWDGMYLLQKLETRPGATRAFVLLGDAPSVSVTRGGSYFGITVPSGLSSKDVGAAVSRTFGSSSEFFGVLVGDAMKPTYEEIRPLIDWYKAPEFYPMTASVKDQLSRALLSSIERTTGVAKEVDICKGQLVTDGYGSDSNLFCGDSPEVAAQLRDLLRGVSTKVLMRRVWITSDNLDDVALLSKTEADRSAQALDKAAALTAGGSCKNVGDAAWNAVTDVVLPRSNSAGTRPTVSDDLHDYWGVSAGRGESLLALDPVMIRSFDPTRCNAYGGRLRDGAAQIRQLREQSSDTYIWFPLAYLP